MTQFPLAERYLAIRPEAMRRPLDLEVALATMVLQARAAHPGITVDSATFVDFLATRLPIDLCEHHLADLYLACACAVGAPGAAARLEELCISQVGKAIGRIDHSAMFVTEIQQRTREKLLVGGADGRPRIAEYGARGSLAAYVRVSAIREALMEKRSTGRHRADELDEPDGLVTGDVTLEMVRREYHTEFQQALRNALATLDRRERAALRLSYLDNLSIDQIGRLFHVHRATAARWITRAQDRVRDLTRAQMQQRLGLSDSETESLLFDLMSVDALSSGMLASSIAEPDSEAA
jgi:RNA polymerase sigma-70 factor, ECF subfamily